MNPHKTILLAVVLLAITAPLALAQGTYTQIDVPGASYTGCGGVDTAGDIVGAYGDSNGNVYGFLLSGGTYTTIVYPGSTNTTLSGINDLGKIVGNSNASANGFLYDVQAQTFTAVTCPNASETFPYAINNAGTIAGTIGYQGFFYGFELVGTRCSHIAPRVQMKYL